MISLLFLGMSLILSQDAKAFGPKRCSLGQEWKTVDTFSGGRSYSAASGSKADFIVGEGYHPDTEKYGWLVRRSFNRGESWSTVDEYGVPENQELLARSVTIEQVTGDLFVAGGVRDPLHSSDHQYWVIRKSSDQGKSWKTVDHVSEYQSEWIEVQGVTSALGVVIAGGSTLNLPDGPFPSKTILRRSEDRGETWTNIDITPLISRLQFVVATSDGAVWVAGNGYSNAENPSSLWVVIRSPNGKDGWKIVDSFTKGTKIYGMTTSSFANKVAVYGTSLLDLAWTVREASMSNPKSWKTLEVYRPALGVNLGFSIAGAATYAHSGLFSTPGSLYVTGQGQFPGNKLITFMTRNQPDPFSSGFKNSYSEIARDNPTDYLGPWAATTTRMGDILTVGANWKVRKLTCE